MIPVFHADSQASPNSHDGCRRRRACRDTGSRFAAGVSPASVSDDADPGETIHVVKTITTPEIPPKPDIVLLVDHTGSMGDAIDSVKAEMANIIATVTAAQPDAQFAVAQYCDVGEGPFDVLQNLTDSSAAAVAAVTGISLCGGSDTPEAQINALWEIGDGGDAITFRPDSSRIVVWFGDAPGHDPSLTHTEADATASLVDAEAQVLAISVGMNQLDSTGQATRITDATDGALVSGIPAGGLGAAILENLQNLPAEVTANVVCDPGLSVAFTPALPQTVLSGGDVVARRGHHRREQRTAGVDAVMFGDLLDQRHRERAGLRADGVHPRQRRDTADRAVRTGRQPERPGRRRLQERRVLPAVGNRQPARRHDHRL